MSISAPLKLHYFYTKITLFLHAQLKKGAVKKATRMPYPLGEGAELARRMRYTTKSHYVDSGKLLCTSSTAAAVPLPLKGKASKNIFHSPILLFYSNAKQ